jgi:hypothetical protein
MCNDWKQDSSLTGIIQTAQTRHKNATYPKDKNFLDQSEDTYDRDV